MIDKQLRAVSTVKFELSCTSIFTYVRMYYVCLITGPPDDITDINISPDTITACSFVVQWSKPSSNPMCGSVWYTVTILTEGGMLIITDNTTMTNYTVTELNDNTVYHVTVTASNNAGSSNVTSMMIMTNSNGKLCVSNCAYTVHTYMSRCIVHTYVPTTYMYVHTYKTMNTAPCGTYVGD